MVNDGYMRFPSIRGDQIVFVSEDDLWTVHREGGVARRLTANLAEVSRPALSPDGTLVAFGSREEHHSEVYCMPSGGGPARRITYLGAISSVRGFTEDGKIVFVSDAGQPFIRILHAYQVSPEGGAPERIEVGPTHEIAFGPGGAIALGRNAGDPARWKRYRGGTAGHIWVDPRGSGRFRRLLHGIRGNMAHPMWVGDRVYFISDHEGIGNLYSCTPSGRGLRRHTDHAEYYARFAQTDGARIVYQCGAELWVFDASTDETARVDVELRSARTQRNRKFVDTYRYTTDFNIHPDGHSIALETRGKIFTMPLWEEAVRQYGKPDGVRYRLGQWLADGKHLVVSSDEGGEEAIEVHQTAKPGASRRLDTSDIGRPVRMLASPTDASVAVANHRMELHLVDTKTGKTRLLDKSTFDVIGQMAFSPDGAWLAYSFAASSQTLCIKLCEIRSGKTHLVTRPDFRDVAPSFDPDGKYLYFLSYRTFDPVYDSLFFSIGFPRAVRPHLVTLKKDVPSPFLARPRGMRERKREWDKERMEREAKAASPKVEIDLDGIADRVVTFPVPEGRYTQVWGIRDKALFCAFPVEGSLSQDLYGDEPPSRGSLEAYDFVEQKHEVLASSIASFKVARDGASLIYRSGRRLRALRAGETADARTERDPAGPKSGWLDLGRVRVSVDPGAEWRQMYHEAWRLQRDHFWVPDMSRVDWSRVNARYLPLVEKVATRLEFSDLIWEMQGELGTSHAYEIGGDYRPAPAYAMGHLGADLARDPETGLTHVRHIVKGDSWDPAKDSPLRAPGVLVNEGDTLLAVGGRPVKGVPTPQALLVNQSGVPVELTLGDRSGKNPRTLVVTTLRDEMPARYREWIEANRRHVHDATGGRVGYVHVPNMGPPGYAEFHRYFLSEIDREALVVDVRFNGGGHVSQLILEKLARKRIGYDIKRWGVREPYPADSVAGPLVCITNEHAGSDGDIFTHCFKLMKLGPVVGKRTWGGVIGIWPRHPLVDGGYTTQPEFSFWFVDVGWGIENYGTDPDFDVDVTPQDHVAGRDPQMKKALSLVMAALRSHRPKVPDLDVRPSLALPVLPKREPGRRSSRGSP
ncbi:MAG: PDZ domain-containing protein [Acidobacteriota bacterium]